MGSFTKVAAGGGIAGTALIAAAQTKPADAASNIAAWLKVLGVDRTPHFLSATGIDSMVTIVGVLLVVGAIIYFALFRKRDGLSDRQRYVATLQMLSVAHNGIMAKLEMVKTDNDLDVIEREYKQVISHTFAWIMENMGPGAASHYGSGIADPTQFRWEGEHSPEHRTKRLGMMQRMILRIKNINELLASDRWDDPVPLRKRKRSKEWKLLKEEASKIRTNGYLDGTL